MRYLRDLAEATGRSFVWPNTQREASEEIEKLKRFRRTGRPDRRRETTQLRREIDAAAGGAAAVRDHELGGHGSTATWRTGG